jgi:hypothetical protein
MVYVLHFSRPYEHVTHYLGVADDVQQLERLVLDPPTHTHAPLILAAHAAGVRFEIGNLFHGGAPRLESLRRQKRSRDFCSTCTPPAYRELRW